MKGLILKDLYMTVHYFRKFLFILILFLGLGFADGENLFMVFYPGLLATMIPVIAGLAAALEVDPTVLYFGLLSGATLGGNCTPIGASANITGIGILRKEGYTVKNADFFKIGIPFTLAAIIPAYIYLWLMYGI